MRKVRLFILVSVLVIVLFLVGFQILIATKGATIAEQVLTKILNEPVKLGQVRSALPWGIKVSDVSIEGKGSIKTVEMYFNLKSLINREIVFSHIYLEKADVYLHRNAEKTIALGKAPQEKTPSQPPVSDKKKSDPVDSKPAQVKKEKSVKRPSVFKGSDVKVEELLVEGATLRFTDISSGRPLSVTLDQVFVKAGPVFYPLRKQKVNFDVKGLILSEDVPFSNCKVSTQGWIDVVGKNMDAGLRITNPNGKEGLKAVFKAVNNDLEVTGQVSTANLISGTYTDQLKPRSVEGFLLGAMQATGVDVMIDLAFKTKMDDFKLGDKISLNAAVMHGSKQEAEVKKPEESFKEIGEKFEAFGRQFYEKNIKNPSSNDPSE